MRVERLTHGQGTVRQRLAGTLHAAIRGQPPVPLSITTEGQEETQAPSTPEYGRDLDGMGLFSPEGPAVDAEEEAFIRAMQRRKKKKKRKGLGM